MPLLPPVSELELTYNQLYGNILAMKTTLDLPDDLMRELKIRAASQGRKLKDVTAETLRNGLLPDFLRQAHPKPVISTDPELGHRVVKGSGDAPVSTMSIEEILTLEQDTLHQEDLQRAGISL